MISKTNRDNLPLHQIFLEINKISEFHSSQRVCLGKNSYIKTNQYVVRVPYKLNTLIILKYAKEASI